MRKIGNIEIKTVETESDLYLDMALAMFTAIKQNNAAGKRTVLIVPVGPTGQYPVFARLVNAAGLSLRTVFLFNMDEYLIDPQTPIASDDPMSFRARMETELYAHLDPALTVPEDQRFFPLPGGEAAFDARLAELGGADLCLGGLGINGHIAFNEPPEPGAPMGLEDFANLPTRVLPVSRETRAINAQGYTRGDIRGVPAWCASIGMRQILAARAVYIALNRPWQHGIAAHALKEAITPAVPASLLQAHANVRFVMTEAIGEGL